MSCPLCRSKDTDFYFEDRQRVYKKCNNCALIFVPEKYWLDEEQEKNRYDLHENNFEDLGYQRFLARIIEPLLSVLNKKQKKGLDFGCGCAPVLARLLSKKGFDMQIYDKFFQPDTSVLAKKYDFITTTEVVEHLHQPKEVLQQLWNNLKTNGILAIMTKLVIDKQAFSTWHYKNDDTHIVFFSKRTFRWLAQQYSAKITFFTTDIIILQK